LDYLNDYQLLQKGSAPLREGIRYTVENRYHLEVETDANKGAKVEWFIAIEL
jgi:hypothetical protein